MSRRQTAVIIIVIVALVAAIAAGVWYYKTKFYVPDKTVWFILRQIQISKEMINLVNNS